MKANGQRRAPLIQHFLLVFDHDQGELVEQVDFGDDGQKAVDAYAAKEREYQGREKIEIVLIGSDSIETIKLTHANYFDGTVASKYFADID